MRLAFTVLLSALLASAAPTRRDTSGDIEILRFALTVEHLENAFYTQALKQFNAAAFEAAGFPKEAHTRFLQLAGHEAQHVQLLTSTLNSLKVQVPEPCNYTFPYNSVKTFAALSAIFEGVGVGAYTGAGKAFQNRYYNTVAGSLLAVEARNQAWVNSVINKEQPWSGAEDTPLTPNQVSSLAKPFIVSCPASNPALPGIQAFPSLSASPSNAPSGTTVTYKFTGGNGAYYAQYLYGLTIRTVKLTADKKAKIPPGLLGTYYTVITSTPTWSDATTVAGGLVSIVNF